MRLQGLTQREMRGDGKEAPFRPEGAGTGTAGDGEDLPGQAEAFDRIARGGFPEALAVEGMDPGLFFSSCVGTYLERDVRELVSASMESAFLDFLRVLASRTAQELNFHSLSRETGVSVPTARSWVSILETSGLVYRLRPWRANVAKRTVDTPKIHFLDTGLCCALCGIRTGEEAAASPLAGALLESFAVGEVLKSHWHAGLEPQAHYYRDQDGREIDLLLWERGKLWPVEIKRSATPDVREIARTWETLRIAGLPLGEAGAVACTARRELPVAGGMRVVNVLNL